MQSTSSCAKAHSKKTTNKNCTDVRRQEFKGLGTTLPKIVSGNRPCNCGPRWAHWGGLLWGRLQPNRQATPLAPTEVRMTSFAHQISTHENCDAGQLASR